MKFVFQIISVSILILACSGNVSNVVEQNNYMTISYNNIHEYLIGDWYYRYSLVDGVERQVDVNTICPTYHIRFVECDSNINTCNLPQSIYESRMENILKKLCCETFDQRETLIDIYCPVAEYLAGNSSEIQIYNYGKVFKNEYYITHLDSVTLILYDDRVYNIHNKEIYRVHHTFKKK